MFEALDVRCSVRAFLVADGYFDDLKVVFCRAEEQVKVAERVEIAEVSASFFDFFVVCFEKDFRAAECVFDALVKEPGEDEAEHFVAEEVEGAHGFFFHGIDESCAVDEFAVLFLEREVEFGEVFRRNSHVRVKDHEDVAGCLVESFPDGVSFASAGSLVNEEDFFIGIFFYDVFDCCCAVVFVFFVDKDDFLSGPESRNALDDFLDVACFVAGRDDYRCGIVGKYRIFGAFACDDVFGEAECADEGQWRDVFVQEGRKKGNVFWHEQVASFLDHVKPVEVEEILNVVECEPILSAEAHFQFEFFCECKDRLPEVVVIGDYYFGVISADGAYGAECFPDIVEVADKVLHNNIVEWLGERFRVEVFGIHRVKMKMGIASACLGEHALAEVNANAVVRAECVEEVAVSGSEFENMLVGWDEKLVEFAQLGVIILVLAFFLVVVRGKLLEEGKFSHFCVICFVIGSMVRPCCARSCSSISLTRSWKVTAGCQPRCVRALVGSPRR